MTLSRRIILEAFGGPEVMSLVTETLPPPAPDEVRLRQRAIGFNLIDTYQRRGAVPLALPSGLGFEAAGVVEAVGHNVDGFVLGDRVTYMNAGPGAYADYRNVPAQKLVLIPAGISDETAAAMLLKGLTAQYLVRRTHAVKPGDLLLVHTAAGGVGQILTQWATALGATVIGTTSSPHKRDIALAAGCAAVIDTNDETWPTVFLNASGGRKADVVYDAVGKATLLKSLQCAAPFGLVVCYGAASGPALAIDPELLNKNGCLFLTRPSVFPHNAEPAALRRNAADLFNAIDSGHVHVNIGARFSLNQISELHRAAEAREITGSAVIFP